MQPVSHKRQRIWIKPEPIKAKPKSTFKPKPAPVKKAKPKPPPVKPKPKPAPPPVLEPKPVPEEVIEVKPEPVKRAVKKRVYKTRKRVEKTVKNERRKSESSGSTDSAISDVNVGEDGS